jgi:uncharacterized protein
MIRYIYLHGFASGPSSSKARFFAARFAERGLELAVPALDGGDFEHLTISGQLRMLETVADGAPAVVIGSSLGGWLAALYAARHPEVEKLVLLAPAFAFPSRWQDSLGSERMAEWRRSGTLNIFHYGAGAERQLGYELLIDARSYEDFPEIAQPALILHGTRDDIVPAALSIEFAAGRKNVRTILLDTGHQMTEVFSRLWEETQRFLALPALL